MTFAKLFSGAAQAAHYANHRPAYPQHLYENILDFASGPRSLAIDIACGSGQATATLAGLFDKVVALDGSEEQLQHAPQLCNVEYQERDAHSTGLPDRCADLVTVAQALHWFNHTDFHKEVRRVLKPTGTFAAWTYSLPILNHRQHPAQEVLLHLYHDVLGQYWAGPRKHVDVGYRGIEPGPEDFGILVRRELETTETQTVDHLLGFLRSWSAYVTYTKQHPDMPDPVEEFRHKLMEVLQATDSKSAHVNVIYPIALIMAKEPVPP